MTIDPHHFKKEDFSRSEKIQRKDAWKEFAIPTKKKKENVSDRVDQILLYPKRSKPSL